jgi:hypothetical protein
MIGMAPNADRVLARLERIVSALPEATCERGPQHATFVASDSDRFYLPAYLGPRGWVALRLDRGRVDWAEVAELLTDGYLLAAPKRLGKLVDAPPTI